MKRLPALICLASLALVLSGCVALATGGHHPRSEARSQPAGYGPPPHAPAHGYRHKYERGLVLQFDSGIGVYLVLGHPGIYFYDGFYLRRHTAGHWLSSRHYTGPWKRRAAGDVPPRLEKRTRERRR